MDPAALLPLPDAIPVPWGWFQGLLLVTFLVHILLVNILFGSAFIALISHLRPGGVTTPSSEGVSRILPFVIAFTVNFGVAPLLFLQVLYGHFFYTSSILMAVFWLSVIGLLITAYALAYLYKHLYRQLRWGRFPVLLVIVLLLVAIAFVFVNNVGMMQNPGSWNRYFGEPRGLLLNLHDPMHLPRFLHFLLASVAVGGLAVAGYFHWQQKRGNWAGMDGICLGCRCFSLATMANIAVGLWFVLSLPRGTLPLSSPTGQLLIAALGGGALLVVPAIRAGLAGRVWPAINWTLGTVVLMVLARDLLRRILLAPWFTPEQLKLQPSLTLTPLVLFLILLFLAVILIAWMVLFTQRGCANKEKRP